MMSDARVALIGAGKYNRVESSIGRKFYSSLARRYRYRSYRKTDWILRPHTLKKCVVFIVVLCCLSIAYFSHVLHTPFTR